MVDEITRRKGRSKRKLTRNENKEAKTKRNKETK